MAGKSHKETGWVPEVGETVVATQYMHSDKGRVVSVKLNTENTSATRVIVNDESGSLRDWRLDMISPMCSTCGGSRRAEAVGLLASFRVLAPCPACGG